jgi:protein phosphatase
MRIEIPEFALVAMVGATSSGKTSFARKHFLTTEVLSSDFFRKMISDNENDQTATSDAFDLLYYAAGKRLSRMRTTVIDATNLQPSARKRVLELAREQDVHSVAIVLNLPERILLERNSARPDRGYPARVIKKHTADLRQSIQKLRKEGFRFVYVLNSPEEIENVEIVRTKLWNNKKEEHGPFDIIGDVHGCYDELVELLSQLGYIKDPIGIPYHPDGRKVAFLGDLCDRGPKNVDVLRMVMGMVKSGAAIFVPGNHDVKLQKYLAGKNVQINDNLAKTVCELESESDKFKAQVKEFLESLISHYVLDDGKLVISHAGIKEQYIGRGSGRVRDFCLYGETNGQTDEYGLPVRLDWTADYRGNAIVVYGHTPSPEVQVSNNTWGIDTGCVFGGRLTALRYPEMETVSINALRPYYESPKPIFPPSEQSPQYDDLLTVGDVNGKMIVNTKLIPSITVNEQHTAAALEVMSRFAADPHWLIYLPPTMSPCETSKLDGYLEHPVEAFTYYRNKDVTKVICEKKHMGSRAVIVLCHTTDVAAKRFGINDGSRGIIYTRTGRHFFEDRSLEQLILERLDRVLTDKGFWKEFHTDWVCLDTELMPWSEKAQALLQQQYAPVGRAGRDALDTTVKVLLQLCQRKNIAFEVGSEVSGQNVDPNVLLNRYNEKLAAMNGYVDAYREYCWTVNGPEDLRIAPFHLLATEGKVFSDQSHIWHMETIKQYCTGIDPIFIATDYIEVDTTDDESVQYGIKWWMQLTENGGEGMVVKPEYFTAHRNIELLQPAIKCRGVEYLRIIYGPEYLMPDHLKRLKNRSLTRKRSLALREFALGMEALDRFVHKEPLYKIHECVFGVLAFESEPVDPRL